MVGEYKHVRRKLPCTVGGRLQMLLALKQQQLRGGLAANSGESCARQETVTGDSVRGRARLGAALRQGSTGHRLHGGRRGRAPCARLAGRPCESLAGVLGGTTQ